MNERTWSFGRCDEYPDGPWSSEPDKVQWVDEATGLDCLILRNRLGALCGYVGIPPQHPWHGIDYDACTKAEKCDESWCSHMPDVDVHGGLTFAAKCRDDAGDDAICHVPLPGREPDVWWFGFDTAHWRDLVPGMIRDGRGEDPDERYRDIGYVKGECASLAGQLAAVTS